MKDDAQLIDEALAGDGAAFGQLVTRYQDRLYNSLVHVVGSTDTAYDVLQDALVQAFVKLSSFQRASGFYTWLYRIAFNLAATRRRRQKPTVSVDEARESLGQEPVDRAASRPAIGWNARNGPARCRPDWPGFRTSIGRFWCSARLTNSPMRKLPRFSTCRWAQSAAACTGRVYNCASSSRNSCTRM